MPAARGPTHASCGRHAAVALLSTLLLSGSQHIAAQSLPPKQAAAIDSFVRQMMSANLETATPLTLESVFELASVTKQFTAAAIMLLANEGKLAIDSPITTYIDSAPPTWQGITLRHLLNHTSGIFAGGVIMYDNSPLQAVTARQAFRQIAAARAFGPGRTGAVNGRGLLFTFYLTTEGKVAHMRWAPEEEL